MTWAGRKIYLFISTAIVVAVLFGCTTGITWDPGMPDKMTVENYRAAMTAIDTKSKIDAQAALYLLRNDVTRMRANSATIQEKLAGLDGVIAAVDKEDWDAARNRLLALRTEYSQP